MHSHTKIQLPSTCNEIALLGFFNLNGEVLRMAPVSPSRINTPESFVVTKTLSILMNSIGLFFEDEGTGDPQHKILLCCVGTEIKFKDIILEDLLWKQLPL